MAKQLVVSGNRIIAYGEDCFLSMGGTVICTETERVFQNATVVNCDCIPCDLDEVGYEYHAGEFVPCGIPFLKDCAIETVDYIGTGTAATKENPMKIPLTINPDLIVIAQQSSEGYSTGYVAIMTKRHGVLLDYSGNEWGPCFSMDGKYVTWFDPSSLDGDGTDTCSMNVNEVEYTLIAIGKGRCN